MIPWISSIVALSALSATLLGALAVTVWRGSAIVTRLTTMLEGLSATVAKLEAGLARLEEIPALKIRVEQLENFVRILMRKTGSGERLAVVETKIEDVRKRLESSPDLSHFVSPIPRTS